ncbi:hypothetical protein QBC33DRAFT_376609 [Phialemonium atrogriseum]|uniref:Uncharacterized protein n=1 Tax=Phialemonium atrogriseum TaxID=1093897 RepID=A0AAJ0FMM5_9PEZI|nr:uncharacterized protein QBC33DRAFT_376609 [Phialemonium atrogriseum]KAK1768418.1 hypothetical protein QBC33DRAFT_376609 [Phialemonium atrogriseum]
MLLLLTAKPETRFCPLFPILPSCTNPTFLQPTLHTAHSACIAIASSNNSATHTRTAADQVRRSTAHQQAFLGLVVFFKYPTRRATNPWQHNYCAVHSNLRFPAIRRPARPRRANHCPSHFSGVTSSRRRATEQRTAAARLGTCPTPRGTGPLQLADRAPETEPPAYHCSKAIRHQVAAVHKRPVSPSDPQQSTHHLAPPTPSRSHST